MPALVALDVLGTPDEPLTDVAENVVDSDTTVVSVVVFPSATSATHESHRSRSTPTTARNIAGVNHLFCEGRSGERLGLMTSRSRTLEFA